MSDVSPDSATRLIAHVAESISVDVGSGDAANAVRAAEMIRREISRLEQMFSVSDDASMLNRWIAVPSTNTTDEFNRLLAAAIGWQRMSRGAYNISMRGLRDLWDRAAAAGCQPSPGELHEAVEDIADPPYRFETDALRQLRDCSVIDLDAIVPGFVIDIAVDKAMRALDLGAVTVSTRNRTLHRSAADTHRSDTAFVECFGGSGVFLQNAALTLLCSTHASNSGRPDDVLDPLTGRRVSNTISVAVTAPDAVTADAVATAVRVMSTEDGLDFVCRLNQPVVARHPSEFTAGITSGPIRCLILDSQRCVHDSDEHGGSSPESRPLHARRIKPARPSRLLRWRGPGSGAAAGPKRAPGMSGELETLEREAFHLNGPVSDRVRVEDADGAGPESQDPGAPLGHGDLR
ncbi:MAG: FAD:protein FMN transferase [Ilumatobacter sp.]|uniref:FAD:protein FMN transferase n=1 Tax=Ilumatobacter sp. TaxID=1967498 RepID=UPI00329752A9